MGNTVDLSPWKNAPGYEDFGADARHVWDMADMCRYTDAAVSLVDLLKTFVRIPQASTAFAHVAFYLSSHLDARLIQRLICPNSSKDALMFAAESESNLGHRHFLDLSLVRYVYSVRDTSGAAQNWSLCPDKGECGQMTLQQAVGSFGAETAFIAAPQAALLVLWQAFFCRG